MRPLSRRSLAALALTMGPAVLHAQGQPQGQQPPTQPAQPGQPARQGPSGPRPGGPGGPGGAPVPTAPGSIGGVVVNAAGTPVASAAVTIRSAADSSLVGGALAKPDGSFRIEGLRPGRYHVRVRALGYAPLVKRDVAVTPDAFRADIGRVALAPVATQLSGVRVEAEREEVSLAPDRNSYATKDMPATAGGTAVDVLRNVPAVEVDGDNNVSLRGNSSVVVQINGRVSPMRGQQLGNYLAQLPANLVAKVEVVPNPSAKNDPDGMAGIINIVLKQQTDLGTSGGFTGGGGSTGQANLSGNLGHQEGRWTLFSSYGFFRDRRTVDGWSRRQTFFTPVGGAPGLDADIEGTMLPSSHSVTGTAEYKAGKKDVIGNNLLFNHRDFSRDNGAFYRALASDGALVARNDQLTDQAQRESNLDYALNWKRSMVPNKHTLTTEVRYNLIDGRNDVLLTSDLFAADGNVSRPRQLETNLTDERQHALFAQTDWVREVRAGTKVETGYKGIFRQQRSDFDVAMAEGSGGYVPDLGQSNAFTYRENVQAVYGLLSQRVGTVDLQGGLRLEQADAIFNLTTTGERYDLGYRSAFPSAIATYNLDPSRQLKASYSKRIQRPDVRQLNPFGFREDALNIFQGNPGLRPEYTHSYELGYQHSLPKNRGSFQLTPFYRHTVNAVRMIGNVTDEGILRVSFANAATSDQYGSDVNFSWKPGRLNLFGGGTVFGQQTNAANIEGARDVSAFGWSARANATFKVTPKLDAQGFIMYRAPQRTEQGRMASFSFMNLALKQKLRGDAAAVTLRVMDPLGTMGWRIEASDGRVIQLMDRRFGARGVFLNFNYTFGKPPKIRQPQGGGEPLPAGPGMGPG